MPKIKSRRGRPRKGAQSKLQQQQSLKWFRWGESYVSLMMGVIVVVIAFLFVGSIVKVKHIQQTSSTSIVAKDVVEKALDQTPPSTLSASPKEYTVQEGDDLWSIAQKVYNSGYKWVAIAKANNLENPGVLYAGTKLTLPDATPSVADAMQPTVSPTATATTIAAQPENAIKDTTYTVKAGDDLWDIAVRAYADGYKWTEIATANNLTDPNLIFSGNILKLPR